MNGTWENLMELDRLSGELVRQSFKVSSQMAGKYGGKIQIFASQNRLLSEKNFLITENNILMTG